LRSLARCRWRPSGRTSVAWFQPCRKDKTALYVESITYGYDMVWPHRHNRPPLRGGRPMHCCGSELVDGSAVSCRCWRADPDARQAARMRAWARGRRGAARHHHQAARPNQSCRLSPRRGGQRPCDRGPRASMRSAEATPTGPRSAIAVPEASCARQQAGGRLHGLPRLLAGRSRRAPGGAHYDVGAGARGDRCRRRGRPPGRTSRAVRPAVATAGSPSSNESASALRVARRAAFLAKVLAAQT
jgi:hypothetical protein